MKISEDVRQYAREQGLESNESAIEHGLAEKSKEFLETGAEIYTSADKK
jgi:phosphomethylpyrimidine synthase